MEPIYVVADAYDTGYAVGAIAGWILVAVFILAGVGLLMLGLRRRSAARTPTLTGQDRPTTSSWTPLIIVGAVLLVLGAVTGVIKLL